MKLSPLHAALVAHTGILGPEPLDLNDGPEVQMPQAVAPEEMQPEIAAQASAVPTAEAEAAQMQPAEMAAENPKVPPAEEGALQVQPAEVEAIQVSAVPVAEEQTVRAVAPPVATGELKPTPAVVAHARPVRKSRGIKRKQVRIGVWL